MKFRLGTRKRAKRVRELREEADAIEHIGWAARLPMVLTSWEEATLRAHPDAVCDKYGRPLRSRGQPVLPGTPEDEEVLLKAFGKTSDKLADEAEKGYDLTKVKHEFVPMPRKPSPSVRDNRCRVCTGEKYSWPHLAMEITNPESFDFSRDDEKY